MFTLSIEKRGPYENHLTDPVITFLEELLEEAGVTGGRQFDCFALKLTDAPLQPRHVVSLNENVDHDNLVLTVQEAGRPFQVRVRLRVTDGRDFPYVIIRNQLLQVLQARAAGKPSPKFAALASHLSPARPAPSEKAPEALRPPVPAKKAEPVSRPDVPKLSAPAQRAAPAPLPASKPPVPAPVPAPLASPWARSGASVTDFVSAERAVIVQRFAERKTKFGLEIAVGKDVLSSLGVPDEKHGVIFGVLKQLKVCAEHPFSEDYFKLP